MFKKQGLKDHLVEGGRWREDLETTSQTDESIKSGRAVHIDLTQF
jgi:hypothetical protein